MRLVNVVFAGLIAAGAQAQSPVVNGPTLGFTSEAHGTAIRQIIGIPDRDLAACLRGVILGRRELGVLCSPHYRLISRFYRDAAHTADRGRPELGRGCDTDQVLCSATRDDGPH